MARRTAPHHRPATSIYANEFERWTSPVTIRPEGTKDYLLVATISGEGRFRYTGGKLELCKGDLFLTQPNTPHDYGAKRRGDWRIAWAHFTPRPHWMDWMRWPEASPGLMHLRVTDDEAWQTITQAMYEAISHVRSPLAQRLALAMNALERVLIRADAVNPASERARFDPRIAEAMEFICKRIDQPIAVGDVAKAAHLSASRLSHLFREQVGLTPVQFAEQQRMDRAKHLLQLTALPIAQIAEQLGYQSPFYFSRRFTRATGMSPRAWRASNG